MTFTHARLLVENYEACFRFYRDVMGFEVVWGDEAGSYADFRAGDGILLAINDRGVMKEVVGETPSSKRSDNAVLIFHVDTLESAVQTLKERGAAFVTEIQDRPSWGIRTIYLTVHLRDSAGNLLELNTPLPS